jgi:hypothetical protein
MAKTYLQTVTFNHESESFREALGASQERLIEAVCFPKQFSDDIIKSEMLERLLDSGILQGGDIAYLIYTALFEQTRSKADIALEALVESMMDAIGEDEDPEEE